MLHATIVTRSVPGLDNIMRARLLDGLNQSLATITDLATAYKQAHWNLTGINFSQLHALFDQFADQTREYVDLIAERAVQLGGVARGTIQAAAEHTALPEFPIDERREGRLLEELVARLDILDSDLRQAMYAIADEPATQDVYIEIVRGIEKQRWMLQAHLAHQPAS